jgi:hypothetical protein
MTRPSGSHENYRSHENGKTASDRSFGLVFTTVFLMAGGYLFYTGSGGIGVTLTIAAVAILAVALLRPRALAVPNRIWMKFGLLLHRVANPVVMGAMFLLVFTPFGLVMRAFGKDPLHRRLVPQGKSYWIDRETRDPAVHSMRNQF